MAMNLGELILTLYEDFLAQYGDESLASVATAAVINDFLSGTRPQSESLCRAAKLDGVDEGCST